MCYSVQPDGSFNFSKINALVLSSKDGSLAREKRGEQVSPIPRWLFISFHLRSVDDNPPYSSEEGTPKIIPATPAALGEHLNRATDLIDFNGSVQQAIPKAHRDDWENLNARLRRSKHFCLKLYRDVLASSFKVKSFSDIYRAGNDMEYISNTKRIATGTGYAPTTSKRLHKKKKKKNNTGTGYRSGSTMAGYVTVSLWPCRGVTPQGLPPHLGERPPVRIRIYYSTPLSNRERPENTPRPAPWRRHLRGTTD